LHDLTFEIGDHIQSITAALDRFTEMSVPSIVQQVQQRTAANLVNLSTVATFFSAITATTLQFSYGETDTPIKITVNALWFSSLILSIAAAVSSLMGLTWKQAVLYVTPFIHALTTL